MSNLIPFTFDEQPIRVIEIDGDPWFVGKDVAEALGYANTRGAIATHCKAAKSDGVVIRDAMGREQSATIIPERDVYRLIMRSKLPAAERFEEWVVGEVLPAIRRTGGYQTMQSLDTLVNHVAARLEGHLEKMLAAAIAADPRVAVSEFQSSLDVAKKAGFPPRKRRGIVRSITGRLLRFCNAKNYDVRQSRETGKWLFAIKGVDDWLVEEGRSFLKERLDALRGQGSLTLVKRS